jgi:hypothetical protein
MLDSEKLAIAAHLHVAMRRKLGRVTDVEWMVRSEPYAREIVRLALAEPDQPELHGWAQRLLATLPQPPVAGPTPTVAQMSALVSAGLRGAPVGVKLQAPPAPWPRDTQPADLRPVAPAVAAAAAPRYVGGLR